MAGVTVKAPHELKVVLAKMKMAKAQGVNMNVWDSEIKAVADAIATIVAIRNLPLNKSPPPQQ